MFVHMFGFMPFPHIYTRLFLLLYIPYDTTHTKKKYSLMRIAQITLFQLIHNVLVLIEKFS